MAVASWEVNQTGFLDRPRLQGHPSPAKSQTGDSNFKVSKLYGMLPAETEGDAKSSHARGQTDVRSVFVIGPDKKVKLIIVYPMKPRTS